MDFLMKSGYDISEYMATGFNKKWVWEEVLYEPKSKFTPYVHH